MDENTRSNDQISADHMESTAGIVAGICPAKLSPRHQLMLQTITEKLDDLMIELETELEQSNWVDAVSEAWDARYGGRF